MDFSYPNRVSRTYFLSRDSLVPTVLFLGPLSSIHPVRALLTDRVPDLLDILPLNRINKRKAIKFFIANYFHSHLMES